jgi:hypothetical protein
VAVEPVGDDVVAPGVTGEETVSVRMDAEGSWIAPAGRGDRDALDPTRGA